MILRNALLAFLVGKSPVCWVCLLYSFTATGEDNCIVLISVLRQEVVRALFCMQKGEGPVVINDHRIDKILEKEEVVLYNTCMDNFARRI